MRLNGVPLGRAPALLANIRLRLGGLPATNALAYLASLSVTSKGSFIALAPGLRSHHSEQT
jgi:hypothetical protein